MYWTMLVTLTVSILATAAPLLAAERSAPVTVGFELKANLIVVDTKIDGVSKRFVLDTGASATVIARELAKELALKSIEKHSARGAGGDVEVSLVAVKSLDVGGAVVHDVTCAASDISGIEERLGGHIDGVLGFNFLSRFKLTIDYKAKKLILDRYPEKASAPDRVDGDQ